jgi:hypothetical protein
MNATSRDIVDMLEAYGDSSGISLDLRFADNLHVGKEPSTPIKCVTIYDTGGPGPDLGFTTKDYCRPSFQIRVRHSKYLEAMSIAEEIKTALHGKAQETWNGTLYTVILCTSDPALLEYDENGNAKVVINFSAQRRPA